MAARTPLDEETSKKVLRQVEYYFGQSSLPKDEYLKKLINESEDGLVSLALICSFSRMRSHLGLGGNVNPEDISEETVGAVADTLRKSIVLKVSEDGKRIGRNSEFSNLKPEEISAKRDARTIAASPMKNDITREEVETFFSQYGKVNSVRLPRHIKRTRFFCGTALIEFATEDEATNILKQDLTYVGSKLELRPKKDFDAEREEKMSELEKSRSTNGYNNGNSETDYPKGLIVAIKLKHISAAAQNGISKVAADGNECKTHEEVESTEDAVEETVDDKITIDGTDESMAKSDEGCQDNEEKAAVGERPSAAASKDNKDIVLREDIKNVFNKFGTVKYVDYMMGAESGYIRFEEPEAGEKARAAAVLADGGLVIKNYLASLEAVTGEAEKEYWSLLRGSQDKRRDGRGNRGRGGKNFKGRRRDDSNAGRPSKAQKV